MSFLRKAIKKVRSQVQPPMSPEPTSMGNKFDRMFGMSRQSPRPNFFSGGLGGSIFERLIRNNPKFGGIQSMPMPSAIPNNIMAEPSLPMNFMPQDMPMERFPVMRPGFAKGEEVNIDMMMADQGARQGMSPAEQRMMMIKKTAADMGRTISDNDAKAFGMGMISFEEAMSRARPMVDMGQVAMERNMMQQEQLGFAAGDEVDVDALPKGLKAMYDSGPKGREGVEKIAAKTDKFAEGGAVESEIDKGLEELQGVAPEAMVIQQVMTMVMEMIASGASEEQIVAALKEMGLDEEDIQQVMMMVASEMQGQDSIDGQLAQMM
jgi:hypothetical protein